MDKKDPLFNELPPLFDNEYHRPAPAWESYDDTKEIPDKTLPVEGKKKTNKFTGNAKDLNNHLKTIFHFDSFRPYQKKVCESVITGNDLLLVMPTGSGKSLCYQLPGIALGGTTLVISPLIALMEDQTASLKKYGLNAERIHSGRTRLQSREVSRRYLDGDLDFLFIAPERLSVPGFPEMLAKRRPTLIAIDEAHCISQWGHDFRPDYRLLGDRLPILRPAPVIAMTATATPRVQDDIIQQLGLPDTEMHIHGFRRTNIAIEIIELLPSDRTLKVREILKKRKNLPAIIYAPTRQKTEDLAGNLKDMIKVEPYHAGISSDIRDRVQTSFLEGKLDAIVATIAFGMGIDKPDIRTVIHTAMPGSLEGYYQEIGRAGRDNKSSRAILLQSYGDRQVHLFFHEKSYPDESRLNSIFKKLKTDSIPLEKLRGSLDIEEEEFDNAVEKLWIHGGAKVVSGDWILKGHNRWNVSYHRQKSHRLKQIDEIARFANSYSCRMLYLINHFGDSEDKGNSCGICDVCDPGNTSVENTREPDLREQRIMGDIISLLKNAHSLGTGKLYNSTCPGTTFPRSAFEGLLRSLVRNSLITLSDHSFDKNGDTIHYKRAELTHNGYSFNTSELNIVKVDSSIVAERQKKKQHRLKKPKTAKATKTSLKGSTENPDLYQTLKTWRNNLAKKRGIPAFRIFSNKVLSNLSSELPATEDELLMVNGVGPYFVERHGDEVIDIIRDYLRKNEDE